MDGDSHINDETEAHIFQRGMDCIKGLPGLRERGAGVEMCKKGLRAVMHVLQRYLDSAKHSSPPSKKLLHEAAKSLMQEGAVLSQKWDKTQLALVIQRWALAALRLENPKLQYGLFVQARVSEDNPKVLSHKCCMQDELSEEVISLSIASPSPLKPRGSAATRSAEEADTESEFGLDDFDKDFLAEIDELAHSADLAAIPVHFYTPWVPSPEKEHGISTGEAYRHAWEFVQRDEA